MTSFTQKLIYFGLLMMLASCSNNNICSVSRENLKELRGLKIGMDRMAVEKVYPRATVEPDYRAELKMVIYPTFKADDSKNTETAGIWYVNIL